MKQYAPKKAYDQNHPFYYKEYSDNLFCPLAGDALQAYEEGSGSETKPYIWRGFGKEVSCPPKMASIASSSAMTFNLLGDGPVTVPASGALPSGTYCVQYEKQMKTLNIGSGPANLDAFLSSETEKNAIFCEMKLLEWLGEPGSLKDSYTAQHSYMNPDSFVVFHSVITEIKKCQKNCPSIFKRYDVWQMFKHLLAIYNHTSFVTQECVKQSMAGMYQHIVLVNVVNEFPAERIEDNRTRKSYEKALAEEQAGAKAFVEIIKASGIASLFKSDCHATFEIKYISAKEFADSLDIPKAKRDYLKRYFP